MYHSCQKPSLLSIWKIKIHPFTNLCWSLEGIPEQSRSYESFAHSQANWDWHCKLIVHWSLWADKTRGCEKSWLRSENSFSFIVLRCVHSTVQCVKRIGGKCTQNTHFKAKKFLSDKIIIIICYNYNLLNAYIRHTNTVYVFNNKH